ncbi:carbohydrate ABC transporter permease [Paenibacillus pasadenensis]|uniref:carbohydrate ABC transporter permease n=1 Tax=Paenibacillus pasadenensis TaxID=217090 RepID=UPI00203E39C5|nr:carbohydrate ABC transporter permease [Paenibacillus pasadenensis]MCM3745764.1 carbohydrate ABC transporter permease [Paenibacillus pasadenensis]
MNSRITRLSTHALLILFGIIWIFPFVWMLSSSFKSNREYLGGGLDLIPDAIQWSNYKRAWEVANFSTYFNNSIVLTVAVVAIVVVTSALCGYALGRVNFKGRTLFLFIITSTIFIPKGYTIIPIYMLIKQLGLLNSMPGVILAEAGGAQILFILLFTAHFKGMPGELEESAEIDGAGFLRTFFRIMLPLSTPIIATTILMQFMWTWNSFLTPLIFTLNTPDLRTLSVGMFSFIGQYQSDYTGLTAAASIALLPVMIVFIALQRYFVEGIAGAVKG